MSALWWVACARVPETLGDPTLPELSAAVEARAPRDVLADGAESEDPAVRARAAAHLVRLEGVAASEAPLADPSDWVQRAAVEALGERGDEASRARLLAVAADAAANPDLRARAALLVGPAAAPAMSAAVAAERQPWRVAPLAVAAARLGEGGARPALLSAVASGELGFDLPFLRMLAEGPDPTLVDPLRQAAARAEPELLGPLAVVRLAIGDPEAPNEVRRALAGPDDGPRMDVVDLLAQIDPATADPLLRRAAERADLVGQYAAVVLAARAGELKPLARAAASDERDLRELAQLALLGERPWTAREASRVVLAGLSDRDGRVRAAACRAAGELQVAEAEPYLRRALADEVQLVRVEAAGALLGGWPGSR